ncbi:MAG TPA: hypothetical protein ENK46_05330 [Flavobacteriia bacterium]|nr:hypothetical protein [Flavobacteriia bacterium]
MKKIATLILLLISISHFGFCQSSIRDQVVEMSEVLGFIYGQKIFLESIKENFPELRNDATRAELKWELAFGKVEKELERRLREILEDSYADFETLSKQKLSEVATFDNISRSDAISYIETVNRRTEGDIEEQFKARVLMYHPDFIQYPHQELSRGYRNEFKSSGYEPKSKGIKLRIQYPASWKEEEGVRPNILFKAISENGEGTTSLNILIKDIAAELKTEMTDDEWKYFITDEGNRELADMIFTESALKEMMSELGLINPNFSEYSRLVIDGNPGAKISISAKIQRLEFEFPIYSNPYVIISKNYLVIATFATMGASVDEAKTEFEKFKPAINLMMNSMAILNRYE